MASSSPIMVWHFTMKTFIASVKSTSGGRMPVDSIETSFGEKLAVGGKLWVGQQ